MRRIGLSVMTLLFLVLPLSAQPVLPKPDFNSTLYIMNWWEGFNTVSEQALLDEAAYVNSHIGSGPYIRVGFQVYLGIQPPTYKDPMPQSDIDAWVVSIMATLDPWIARSRASGNLIELHMTSQLYGWGNGAINAGVALDKRIAQWYYTAPGAEPNLAASFPVPGGSSYWSTPSRYAGKWFEFKRRCYQALGSAFAERFYKHGDVLIAIDGDLEIQLSETRALSHARNYATGNDLADYSPFAVAEFRDWLAHRGEYCDACASNSNALYKGQGRKGYQSFETDSTPGALSNYYQVSPAFSTWTVEGFETPIKQIVPGAFAAPFFSGTLSDGFPPPTNPPLLKAWLEFREFMVGNAVKDTIQWMTSGPYLPADVAEAANAYFIPADRIYPSQIPGEHIGASTPAYPMVRVFVHASSLKTGDPRPYGSPGWTGFNDVGGGWIYRTLDQEFYDRLQQLGLGIGTNWGIFEWNPYVPSTAPPPASPLWPGLPCSNTLECIISEIVRVRQAGPHILAPFSYLDITNGQQVYHVKGTLFETALHDFIAQHKYTPRQYAPGTVFAPPQVAGLTTSNSPSGFPGSTVNGADLAWNPDIFPGVNFSWSAWPQMGSFLIYRGTTSNSAAASQVATPNKSASSFHDVPPAFNQRYYYWIQARNNASPSASGALSPVLELDVCSQYGDLDGNGSLTGAEADRVLRLYLGMESQSTCTNLLANVYKPSSTPITPRDALTLLKKVGNPSMTLPIP